MPVFAPGYAMLLMVDNYDSFTYNLVLYFRELGAEVKVIRNDEWRLDQVRALAPERIVLSPGPGTPEQAGISVPLLRRFGGQVPILGICLGHQCIGRAFAGFVKSAREVVHGKNSAVYHAGNGIFAGLPSPINATRYHSLAVDWERLPEVLTVTAWTQNSDGAPAEIMGLRHKTWPIEGVQFHPEAILSEFGHELLKNFLKLPEAAWI
jgi:anthranilate synthase component 2